MPALFSDGDMWRNIARSTGESYRSGYADTVRALNGRIVKAVEHITAMSRSRKRPALILIHSDHGPGSGLEWEDPERTDIRERLGILLAMRFPDGETPPLEANATPINAYRAVLTRALGAELPPLENRSYYSTWRHPFAYIDMTEKLSAATSRLSAQSGQD
jgi:hypothetical protein